MNESSDDDIAFIKKAYLEILGRDVDDDGLNNYANQLKSDKISREKFIDVLNKSDERKKLLHEEELRKPRALSEDKTIKDIFTVGGHNEYRTLMFLIPIILDAKCVVETGLGGGASTLIFSESLTYLDGAELHTFEYSINEAKRNFGDALALVKSKNFNISWQLHEMDSVAGAKKWSGTKIDFLYLDSDHSYDHVTNELNAFAPHLSKKAIILGDDSWAGSLHDYYNKVNPGRNPSDVYWAFYDWSVKNNWKCINFAYPNGKVMVWR